MKFEVLYRDEDEDFPDDEEAFEYDDLALDELDDFVKSELEKSGTYFEELDSNNLDENSENFLADLRYFCFEYTKEFTTEFWKKIDRYELSPGYKISPKILSFLKEKKFDLPIFVVRNGAQAAAFLKRNQINHTLDEDHLLLEFQLPKHLGYFWWKDKKDSKEDDISPRRKTIGDAGVAWGDIYRAITPIMWRRILNQFGDGKINFERINPKKVHNQKGYYYLFNVSPLP